MFAFKRHRNLKDILVKAKLNTGQVGGMSACRRGRCVTCPHINNTSKLVGPKGYVDIKENFTCTSEGAVYAIECKRCGSLYVGETGRKLSERFREHRRNVLNDKSDNEVAYHFFVKWTFCSR